MRAAATLCCLLASTLANASAVLHPSDVTSAPRMVVEEGAQVDWLPLKDHRVDVEVAGVIAQVRVTQVYQNAGKVPLNAHYMFPAGTRSAVSAMSITVGDRTTRAVLRERGEAQQLYKRAQQEGKTAGLLEQQRPNVLTMKVANVLPGDVVTVELEYTELLLPQEGAYELVLPAVVGPRYASQGDDDAPTVPAPANTAGAAHRYDATVRITSGIPVAAVSSRSHRIGTRSNPDGSVQVVLDGAEADPGNRDFILHYRLADEAIQAGVLVHRAATGTLLAMVEPPQRVTPQDIVPREYIFLVDVSGSMGGTPLQTAQSLVRKLAAALRPADRFNVVLFESTPLVLFKRSVAATRENVRAACAVLDTGRGGGGTEMLTGLKAALELPRTPGMSRTVLLVTDGYVNVEQKAFQLVRSHLDGMNLFAFGIGNSVNRHLIEGMARAGRGEPFIVEGDDRAEAAAARFWNYVEAPLMTDVKVRFEGISVTQVIPAVVPDLFAARPLAVMAHFSGEPRGEMVVTGLTTRGPVELRVPIRARDGEGHKALPLLWARHRLAELSDAVDPETQEANRKETTEVALRYGLLSAYTSFVAVDDRVRNGQPSVDVEQPLPLPAGMDANELGGLMGGLTGGGVGTAYGIGGLGIGAGGGGYGKLGTKGRGASPVSVSAGAVVIMGSLDKSVIKRVIHAHLAEVRYCYERELVRTPGLAGKVVVKFSIGPDGRVRTAVVSTSDLGNAAVERCLEKRVATWVFPKVNGGGVVEVNYPFVFKTAAGP